MLAPSPLVGEGWGEGAYKIKCEGLLAQHEEKGALQKAQHVWHNILRNLCISIMFKK